MDFFKIHELRSTSRRYKVDFEKISKNEEQAMINLIHVQERLVRKHLNITERLE